MPSPQARPVILLDVDGVLNPTISAGQFVLDEPRAELVRQLAQLGTIVWATSWSGEYTFALEQAIGLPRDTARIPLAVQDQSAATPKLGAVSRWIERSLEADTPVAWIDDWLRSDARDWATAQARPILLVQPEATVGLRAGDVASVREFARSLDQPRRP